jgi:hypothetical protein
MNTLLVIAVALIALSIVVQTGVFVAMYVMSRRISEKVEGLVEESRRLQAPIEAVTNNLKTVSEDLAEMGKIAKRQMNLIEGLMNEARETIRTQTAVVRDHLLQSFDATKDYVMRPVRQWSAISHGISVGVHTFFARKKTAIEQIEDADLELKKERRFPAA